VKEQHEFADKSSATRTHVNPKESSAPDHAPMIVNRSPRSPASSNAQRILAQRSPVRRAIALRQIQRCFGNRYVQRMSANLRTTAPVAHTQAETEGTPLDHEVREPLEQHFAADLSAVRIHAGPADAQSAGILHARAYTVGSDIYFGPGEYAPSTADGRKLLAHEVAHTVQQAGASASERIEVGDPADPLEKEAEKAAEKFETDDSAPPLSSDSAAHLRRDANTGYLPGLTPDFALTDDDALAAYSLELEPEDKQRLVQTFPTGFTLQSQDVILTAAWGNTVSSAQGKVFRVVNTLPVVWGAEAYILSVGKGRAILLSSRGGPSIMLDAGEGRGGSVVRGLSAIFGAGLASLPNAIFVSHTDKDHINAIGAVMRMQGMQGATIRIGLEQLSNFVGRGDWARANVNLVPGQSIVRINVVRANGVRVDRQVIGNMEITEFRLVAPAATAMTAGQTASQYKAVKNATSPITVMQDLNTGQTMVFTADGTARAFTDMVDLVGSSAFNQILGAGGRNLQLAEQPHHGGREDAGPDARARVRALRILFENSDGSLRFFTQTSTRFSSTASASIRYLDQVGIATERVLEQPAGAQGTDVVRARGGDLQRLTIDQGSVQQITELARVTETEIMQGYAHRNRIELMLQRARSLHDALEGVRGHDVVRQSLAGSITQLETRQASLGQTLNTYWRSLETAAGGTGMRAGANVNPVNSAATAVSANVTANPLHETELSLAAHERMVSLEVHFIQNSFEMFRALAENRAQDVQSLKVVQNQLLLEAIRVLGAKTVNAEIRKVWLQMDKMWTPRVVRAMTRRLGGIERAQRHAESRFREQLSANIANHLKTRRILDTSGMGTFQPVPLRGRIGAGFMAAIELTRVAFELYEQWEQSELAEEAERQNREVRGQNMVRWWLQRGVVPTMTLVDDDNNPVAQNLSQEQILEIVLGTYKDEKPSFDRVVVTWVSEQDRLHAVGQLALEAFDLDDWYGLVNDPSKMRHEKGHTPFLRQGGMWNTLLFDLSAGEYRIDFVPQVHNHLLALYERLRMNQQLQMDLERLQDQREIKSIKDTGWIRTLRYVWVYRLGKLERLDFGHTRPRFVVVEEDAKDGRAKVKAADVPTYEVMRRYSWPTDDPPSLNMGAKAQTWYTQNFTDNSEGLGYAEDLTEID
jgi:hypothetical protein